MAVRSPSEDRDLAGAESVVNRTKRKVRAEPKLYISFLPDGKGGPRIDKGSVPLELDVEDHIEERSDCEPGHYRIEKKRSGEFSGEVRFYEKEEARLDASTSDFVNEDFESESLPSEVGATSAEIARAVNAALDARDRRRSGQLDPMEQFRQMRELLKEEREEMQRQMKDSGSSQQPRDTLSDFERFIDLQKKLQPEPPPKDDDVTSKDRAQLMLIRETGIIPEFMRSMRDALRAGPEAAAEPGIVDKIISLVQSAIPYVGPVAGPAIAHKLAALVEQVDVGALAQKVNSGAQPNAPSSPTSAPDPRAVAFTRVMRRVAADLIDNAAPDASVAATIQLVKDFPDLAQQFGQILNAPPNAVADFISTQLQDDVRPLSHCNEWIASYQSKLTSAAASASAPVEPRDSESEDSPLTLDDVLMFIKQSIIENKDPAEAVSAVIQLLAEQPQLAPTIQQLMATSNAELVAVLSQSTRTDLAIVANAESFIEKLKAGVTKRLRVPVSASENGNKKTVAAAEHIATGSKGRRTTNHGPR
jgi:hypothetical protein